MKDLTTLLVFGALIIENQLGMCGAECDSSLFHGYDINQLGRFDPWVTYSDVLNATFSMSLCNKLTTAESLGCPKETSVCAKFANGTAVNYGVFHPNNTDGENENAELLLVSSGQPCPEFKGYNHNAVLLFKCGKTLGHPYPVGRMGCADYFEWESYVFCKDFKSMTPEKEVPCTVMKGSELIDLSPLTKMTGGYLVDETENRKVFINVCRDIKTGTADGTEHCPNGAASCKILDKTRFFNFGAPTRRLEATKAGVRLVYTGTPIDGCPGNPKTTIDFECPERGGSKEPVLISDQLCSYFVRWVTEYACPVKHITSQTCKLTNAEHDVDIDLSPLSHATFADHPYVVNVTQGADHYHYYLNLCASLGIECGSSGRHRSSVCQKKEGSADFAHDLGQMTHARLTYSDGELIMKYRGGERCHTDFMRMTIIKFTCNKSAENNGAGYPKWEMEDGCTYTFSWDTKYACIDHIQDDSCRLEANGKRFDLSTLVKTQGKNWDVLVSDGQDDQMFVVNVCHDVLKEDRTAKCPPGSAFCSLGKNGEAKSLGKYTQGLQYHEGSKSLKLLYSEGDKTEGGCVRTTAINFFCLPGVLDKGPRLVHQSQDGCYHELEWHTAAACPLSHKTGDDCKVYDTDAGYHFDLTPLTKTDSSYTTNSPNGEYKFYINVCDTLKGANPCDVAPHKDASVCQEKISDPSQVKKAGGIQSTIQYFDGVLNLTYVNGEPYNNANHNNRLTEIAFLCAPEAGKGSPTYLEEKDYTYAFEWRTSYACPTTPVECVVIDPKTNNQYDLSSLSKSSENWVIPGPSDSGKKTKFYINVCQPLAQVKGNHCSSFAAVCATELDKDNKESLFHGNLGRAEMSPVFENSTNGLKLIYTSGNDCEDNGKKDKFKTSIHFVCVPGKETGIPLTPKLVKPCEYSMIWETAAACPVSTGVPTPKTKEDELPCSFKDPQSDFTFNFMPLYKKDGSYEVKSLDGKKTYKLNICGALSDSVCGKFQNSLATAVCDGSSPVAFATTKLTSPGVGKITLDYKGKNHVATGEESHYTLSFYCNRTAQEPTITLDTQENVYTNFRVHTALACSPQPVECEAIDKEGRVYDLSPLAREDKNWIVIDTRPGHSNLHYHINVCRPVVTTSTMTCPGGAVGGCQTGAKSYNMGYVQSKPVAAEGGNVVTIVYKGGDRCHIGTEHEAMRSTRITFECSGVEHDPIFESESDTCEYRFIWRTPSACPQHRVVGSGCKVTEPLYQFEFDLNSLRRTSTNYKVPGNGYDFYLNICGPLVASTSLCKGHDFGSCQTGGGLSEPVEAGVANDKLIYNSGELSLVYSDGKGNCHGKYNRTTIIQFICDHSKTGEDGLRYVQEQSDCTYMFEWSTSLACPPHKVVDCTFQQGSDQFDLSKLAKVDTNYFKDYPDSNKTYILNICHSLVHTKGQTCPFDSAACEIDLSETDEKKKYHNMGNVDSMKFSYANNFLTLTYSNGDLCPDGKTHRSTKIIFDCDSKSLALGTPKSHNQIGCSETFYWTSSAACPLIRNTDSPSSKGGNCKVKNPQTGYEFDLSSLRGVMKGREIFDRAGHAFDLDVCGPIGDQKYCNSDTGSCRKQLQDGLNGINAGKANGNLLYRDGILVLEYKDGDVCDEKSGAKHSTFINFVCSEEAGLGVPVYVDKSNDCEYYFDWHTSLVCETQITCSVKTGNGKILDFSPLVQKSGKYNVLSNVAEDNRVSGMIYLNLCRPLNPVFGTLCPPGSGACIVRSETNNKPLSLGHVHNNMTYNAATKEAILTYVHGDPCPSNPKVNMSSQVILKCHPGAQLEPELDSVSSDCQYTFMFLTPYACANPEPTPFSKNCKYYDHSADFTYDLSPLQRVTIKNDKGQVFSLNPCGHLDDKGEKGDTSCSQASVCAETTGDLKGSYGRSDKAVASKNVRTLAVKYSEGRSCIHAGISDKASSTILFRCDRTAGLGIPRIMEVDNCEASFLWETSLMCPQKREECTIGYRGQLFDFNFLSQDSGSWNHTDAKKNVYWLNLCQSLHGPTVPKSCPKNAAVCRKEADGTVSMLGTVDSQVIEVVSHSTDSSSVTIKYSHGDTSVCTKGRRRRSDLQPSVLIHLKCDKTLGSPVLTPIKEDDDCVFEFEWKTRIACPVGKSLKEVQLVEGKIKDERSGRAIDLSSLVQEDVHKSLSLGGKTYTVNLLGHQPSGAESKESCQGAAVCQKNIFTNQYRNLGSFSQKKYYVTDEKVEAVFTSTEKCKGNRGHLFVTSTILFKCDKNAKKESLELFYQTSDCTYVFAWNTKSVCLEATPSSSSAAKDNSPSGSSDNAAVNSGSSSSSKIGIGVAVIAGIIVICVLILVLHKPERRIALKYKLKSFLPCGKKTESPFMYSQLSGSSDDREPMLDDPFNPFNEPDEEAEINNGQLPVQVHAYHDDSDEDLLL